MKLERSHLGGGVFSLMLLILFYFEHSVTMRFLKLIATPWNPNHKVKVLGSKFSSLQISAQC